MNFDAWTSTGNDPLRRKRLLVGYVVGLAAVALVSSFVVLTSKNAVANEDEEPVIEAQLATEPEPEPEPPPPPPPPADAPKPKPAPKIQAPTAVPEEPLKEAEANKAELAAESDPFQREEAPPPEAPKPAVVEAPKPPPPKVAPKPEKKEPIRVTENMVFTPVGALAKPEYPADAKAANIEGTVIVKYVIAEDGSVREVKALKGPPELHAACVAAVRTWRFQPILQDGQAVAVTRLARFVMKIKT